ncbi:hypothetical protein BKA67DRAFT_585888 [Truncatella angustata]|uniref:F-box domain-containing protein n=1 Tax=Truncatella angustata TaxID=152316 RepID=A0A9P8RLP6_9PEZI|nr:uncharacterized protein BKA67DRAFT_585888 [Truncatella angustata]KAH6645630.1 hypothetical protein BKA67DRAFT_585888 [Truncatella angustata]
MICSSRELPGTMDLLPIELIATIADHLDSTIDLGNFRLANRSCGFAARPMQAKHIAFSYSSESLENLNLFLGSNTEFARYTKHLSIYVGQWPDSTRNDGAKLPVLTTGRIEKAMHRSREHTSVDNTLEKRRMLNQNETSKCLLSDTTTMNTVLGHLPRLEEVTLRQIDTWKKLANAQYLNRCREIAMSTFLDSIGSALQCLFSILNGSPMIHSLDIHACLDADVIGYGETKSMTHIKRLRIHSLLAYSAPPQLTMNLLRSFPHVEEMSLTLTNHGLHTTVLLADTTWAHLSRLDIDDLWTTEQIIKVFLKQHHHLRVLCMKNVTLSQGTWHSLFKHIRQMHPALEIVPDGSLCTVGPSSSVDFRGNADQKQLLLCFLKRADFPWPF